MGGHETKRDTHTHTHTQSQREIDSDDPMRMFHPINSFVVNRNQWLILLRKYAFFLNLVKHKPNNF